MSFEICWPRRICFSQIAAYSLSRFEISAINTLRFIYLPGSPCPAKNMLHTGYLRIGITSIESAASARMIYRLALARQPLSPLAKRYRPDI